MIIEAVMRAQRVSRPVAVIKVQNESGAIHMKKYRGKLSFDDFDKACDNLGIDRVHSLYFMQNCNGLLK